MKSIILLIALAASSIASAAQLKCWDTDLLNVSKPLMTATIVDNNTLENITFNYRGDEDLSKAGVTRGKVNATERSPYKGLVEYKGFGNNSNRLVLPPVLTKENLKKVLRKGLVNPGENGVVILYSYRGYSHMTKRLSCKSDF